MKPLPLLLLGLAVLSGCATGKTHWVETTFATTSNPHLICDSTGMTVATVMVDAPHVYSVWGGNGAGYGAFETEAQAKKQAESLVSNGWDFRMGSKWLTCRP